MFRTEHDWRDAHMLRVPLVQQMYLCLDLQANDSAKLSRQRPSLEYTDLQSMLHSRRARSVAKSAYKHSQVIAVQGLMQGCSTTI